jgi:hypothetical protein
MLRRSSRGACCQMVCWPLLQRLPLIAEGPACRNAVGRLSTAPTLEQGDVVYVARLLSLTFVYTIAVQAILAPDVRYGVPLRPIEIAAALYAVCVVIPWTAAPAKECSLPGLPTHCSA